MGIFDTRWIVVVGGQLFSKSLRGLTIYKMDLLGLEGFLIGMALLILPFIILFVLVKILPPRSAEEQPNRRMALETPETNA